MNPGEVWALPDGTRRLVLSNATYNESRLNQVITSHIGGPTRTFQPFAVETSLGIAYADRVMMHPGNWLAEYVGAIEPAALATIRRHLTFLLGE